MGMTTQSSLLPANPVGLYYVYWSPFKPLSQWSQRINIFYLFHAYPANGEATGGNTGAVVLRKPGGTIGTNLNSEIALVRSRGQRVLVSVGGAGGQTYLQTKARADAFIASIKSINEELGGSGTTKAIDGIDWNNFEGTSLAGQSTWMTYIGQQLKAYYGDFLITSPPAGFSMFVGGQGDSDRSLLAALYQGDALDWFCPQYYDPSNLNTLSNVRTGMNFYKGSVTVNGQTFSIPDDHVGIGYAMTTGSGTTSRWGAANAVTAYNTMVSEGQNPKGGFNWANYEDTGEIFANQVAVVFTNNPDVPVDTPAFEMVASANVTSGGATTAQLTPPVGKTTSDFQAGYINEDTNPHDVLDLASGKYTEMEWVIQATADADDATQYEFKVSYDGVDLDTYSQIPKWTIGTPPNPPDTTAPSVPTNLTATAVSNTQIDLAWTASTDNVGVTGYKIYRGGSLIATIGNVTTYAATGLAPNTAYTFTVSAIDANANESAQSASAGDTTTGTTGNVPTISQSTYVGGETISGTIVVPLTVNDADGAGDILFTRFYVDGVFETADVSAPYEITWDTTEVADGVHSFYWQVVDGAGNVGQTPSIDMTVQNAAEPPENPTGLTTCTGVTSITGVTSLTI